MRFLFALLCLPVLALAQSGPPWTGDVWGKPYAGASVLEGVWLPMDSFFVGHYEQRFGEHPSLMHWEEGEVSTLAGFGVGFFVGTSPVENPDYFAEFPDMPLTVTWADVQPYTWWRIRRAITGDTLYLPVTQGDPNDTLYTPSVLDYDWSIGFEVGVPDFLNTVSSETHAVAIGLWEGPPEASEPIAISGEVTMARAWRTTAVDTFRFTMLHPPGRTQLLESDPDLQKYLLSQFPHHRYLLMLLVNRFSMTGDCDSLKWAMRQYATASEQNLDPSRPAAPFDQAQVVDAPPPYMGEFQKILLKVCGDTTLWGD